MNDFQLYREQLVNKTEMQERQSGIQKMIARLRKLRLSDNEIFQSLQEDYGTSFTDEQLMAMLNNTK